jgi:flagellar basal body-associated protein FliL
MAMARPVAAFGPVDMVGMSRFMIMIVIMATLVAVAVMVVVRWRGHGSS